MTFCLRAKLRLASLGVIAIVSTLAVIGLYSIRHLERSTHRVAQQLSRVDRIQELRIGVERMVMPANDYLIHGQSHEAEAFASLHQTARRHLEEVRSRDPGKRTDSAAMHIDRIGVIAKSIFRIASPIGDPTGGVMMEEMDAHAYALSADLEFTLSAARLDVANEIASAASLKARVWTAMIVGWILALLIAGAWMFLFARRLARRLVSLQSLVAHIAHDGLDSRVPMDGNDEIGTIRAAFEKMTRDLNRTRQALITAERLSAIGQVTVTVKHEMNNPIQGILSASELLQMRPDDEAMVARLGETIESCALRLSDVVERVSHIEDEQVDEYVGDITMIRLPDTERDVIERSQ